MSAELTQLVKELDETNKKLLSQSIHLSEYSLQLSKMIHVNSVALEENTKVIRELKKHLE